MFTCFVLIRDRKNTFMVHLLGYQLEKNSVGVIVDWSWICVQTSRSFIFVLHLSLTRFFFFFEKKKTNAGEGGKKIRAHRLKNFPFFFCTTTDEEFLHQKKKLVLNGQIVFNSSFLVSNSVCTIISKLKTQMSIINTCLRIRRRCQIRSPR